MTSQQQMSGAAGAAPARPEPIAPSQRVAAIDVLRGLSLAGILAVNVYYHGHPYFLDYSTFLKYQGLEPGAHRLDRLVHGVVNTLCQESFYCLFAFLFAFGFENAARRCESAGGAARAVTRRRLAVLALFGLVHVVLIWAGDILITYALLGLALPLLRRLSDRALVVWAVVLPAVAVLLPAGPLALSWLAGTPASSSVPVTAPADGGPAAASQEAAVPQVVRQWDELMRRWHRHTVEVYASGGFGRIALHRVADYAIWTASIAAFQYPRVLGMYALGVLAARRRLFHEPDRHLPFLRRAARWALLATAAGCMPPLIAGLSDAPAPGPGRALFLLAGDAVRIPALAGLLVAGVLLVCRGRGGPRWLTWLAPAGRMSLTGYLGQSLICSLIFCGYGLGMYGRIGPARGALLAATIFAVQAPLSALWLRFFRYGPVEWLWRMAAYGRVLPLREP